MGNMNQTYFRKGMHPRILCMLLTGVLLTSLTGKGLAMESRDVALTGSDIQYQSLLKSDTSGKKVLRQWTGRGNLKTENFTVSQANWEIYSSNTPDDGINWQEGKGTLQIILHNVGTGTSREVLNSFRPVESTGQEEGSGTYYLEIKSANIRWIVRIRTDEASDTVLTANASAPEVKDIGPEGLPLGLDWYVNGELSSGGLPLTGKTIRLFEIVNDIPVILNETQTKEMEIIDIGIANAVPRTIASYSFMMGPKTKPGNYVYRVEYDDQTGGKTTADIFIQTTRKACLELTTPEKAVAGSGFTMSAKLYDYLDKKPIAGATVVLSFADVNTSVLGGWMPPGAKTKAWVFDDGLSKWCSWGKLLRTDSAGNAVINMAEYLDPVFPKVGEWNVKALFTGGTYDGIAYKPVEKTSTLNRVFFVKGVPKVALSLFTAPSASFAPFKIGCSLTNEMGKPVDDAPVTVLLWATAAGNPIPIPLGVYEGSNAEGSILFPVSLESGNYSFTAQFLASAAQVYVSARSLDLNVGFGKGSQPTTVETGKEVIAPGGEKVIILQNGNPSMIVDAVSREIDPGKGTAPIVLNGRTILPIRAVIETMGGTVDWLGAESKATIKLKATTVEMWIGKTSMKVNGVQKEMDIAPKLIKGRTMMPIRFIAENLGAVVQWNGKTQKAYIRYVP